MRDKQATDQRITFRLTEQDIENVAIVKAHLKSTENRFPSRTDVLRKALADTAWIIGEASRAAGL